MIHNDFDPGYYHDYTEAWNDLNIDITLDGYVYSYYVGTKDNTAGTQYWDDPLSGIRIEWTGGEFEPSDGSGANQGGNPSLGSPPNNANSGSTTTINTNSQGSQGDQGEYPKELTMTIYFDKAFGWIPPGSSLQIITDPTGQHILTYHWISGYGSGIISGDPYLEHYDEPNAKIRFRDSSIVEGGISTFMKTFDYQSGVGGCKDC